MAATTIVVTTTDDELNNDGDCSLREAIIATAERLATAPFRGAAQDDLLPGLRHLALDAAIYWFVPDARTRQIRVLAIFFGGQDHQRHMLVRLLRGERG